MVTHLKKLALSLLFAPLLANAQNKLTDANYRIFSVKQGKEVSLKDMVATFDDYDVVFFGEEHNDSVTHFLENSVLELMHLKFGKDVALSMEMFDRDVQPIMNEYLLGYIREKHFRKDARVWSNYTNYRPMVEYAKDKKLDVICANAATRYTNVVGRLGQSALDELPGESKDNFAPIPYDTAKGKYYKKLMDMQSDPSDTGAKRHVLSSGFDLVQAQSLWDATMAYSITQYLKKNKNKKVLQINGKFHSDEGFAVVSQLDNYNSKLSHVVISATSDSKFPNIDWDKYINDGDFIIITDPKVPRTYED